MFREHALAVSIEVLGDAADALLLQVVGSGEGEWIEALRLVYLGQYSSVPPCAYKQHGCVTTIHRAQRHHSRR